jgi:hypothetical protein
MNKQDWANHIKSLSRKELDSFTLLLIMSVVDKVPTDLILEMFKPKK